MCIFLFDELSVIMQNRCAHAVCVFERKKAEQFHCVHSEKRNIDKEIANDVIMPKIPVIGKHFSYFLLTLEKKDFSW